MLLIGLTGGIASGKTLVSNAFADLGTTVIDADVIAREVVAPNSLGLNALVSRYAQKILTSTGELDRSALRNIIFNDAEERMAVDSILHPLIRNISDGKIDLARKEGEPYIIYAVPLLVETDQQERFDRILVVDVPEQVQIQRLVARDGGTITDAKAILDAQASRKARLAIADDVIVNDASEIEVVKRVAELHELYLSLAG